MFFLALLLLGCPENYTITATTIDAKADTCTFTVQFPAHYKDVERGKQTLTVSPISTPPDTLLEYEVADQTNGVGLDLRRRCAGYLASPEELMAGAKR